MRWAPSVLQLWSHPHPYPSCYGPLTLGLGTCMQLGIPVLCTCRGTSSGASSRPPVPSSAKQTPVYNYRCKKTGSGVPARFISQLH